MLEHEVVGYRDWISARKRVLRAELRRVLPGLGSFGSLALALLLPKCPLCIAAVLSGAGVGAAAAALMAPYLKPLAYVAAIARFMVLLWRHRGAGPKRSGTHCCACSQSSASGSKSANVALKA